jgi:hypothetical protein
MYNADGRLTHPAIPCMWLPISGLIINMLHVWTKSNGWAICLSHRFFFVCKTMNWRTSFFFFYKRYVRLTDWRYWLGCRKVTALTNWAAGNRLRFPVSVSEQSADVRSKWVAFPFHVVTHQANVPIKRNTKTRSRDHCRRDKARRITYTEWSVCRHSYPAGKEHELYYIVICSLSGSYRIL